MNESQVYNPKAKTYKDAQLGELVHSIVIEHTPGHGVAYGSEPTGGEVWRR
jgi:hypothetical protein